jgi:transposase
VSADQTAGARPLRLAVSRDGKVFLTPAQLAMLLEGIDWRQPKDCLRPDYVVSLFILVDAE